MRPIERPIERPFGRPIGHAIADTTDETSAATEDSEIVFGEVRANRMSSSIFWVPVSRSTGYWQVQIKNGGYN